MPLRSTLRAVALCALIVSCAAGSATSADRAFPTNPGDANTRVTLGSPQVTANPQATIPNVTAFVAVGEQFFAPQTLRVKAGTTVTWRNGGSQNHDIRARDGSFVVGILSPGQTYSFTFTKAGRYRYVCSIHEGDGMTGEIVVE